MAIEVVRRTPEQIAGEEYLTTWKSLDEGKHGMEIMALHIPYVLGFGSDKIEHWRRREIPNGRSPLVIELEKPEDYFLKPPREGFGLPSLYFLDGAMRLLGRKGIKALSCLRLAIPDWDARIERERLKQTVKEAPDQVGPGQGKRTDRLPDNVRKSIANVGGNNTDYLAARIKRDAPEIAVRLERGEFKSVRAAAIEAGIVKVLSPLEKAQRLFLSLSDFERNEFLSWVYGE